MEIKEIFDKIPLSTKILGAILIGIVLIFVIYTSQNHQQPTASQTFEAIEKQDKIKADKSQKEYEKSVKDWGELGDKVHKENLEERKVRALEGIKDNLDRK